MSRDYGPLVGSKKAIKGHWTHTQRWLTYCGFLCAQRAGTLNCLILEGKREFASVPKRKYIIR
jgi:hypothetical protein